MIVVYGGSFNPFGRHHYAATAWIAADTKVDRILIVPSAAHASKTYSASFDLRCSIIEASLPRDPLIQLERIEGRMLENGHEGPIYTYDMLKALQAELGGVERAPNIQFAIGPDLLHETPKWYLGPKVAEEFGFYPLPDAGPGRSTTIRNLIAANDSNWKRYLTSGGANVLASTPNALNVYREAPGPLESSFHRDG